MPRPSSTAIRLPNREADAGAKNGPEDAVRCVKIQVGSYAKKISIPDATRNKETVPATTSSSAPKTTASITSSTTLYDLCDSSYNLKYCRRERKKKEALSAEEKSLNEVKSKQSILDNARSNSSSSSSSSSRTKREKEQCGMGPRVEIVNGKIIVRESSLVVSEDSNFIDGEYEEVVEGNNATATYSSFLTKRHSFSWGIEETRLFYQCLRQCGTEFSIMQSFFPGRTRKQLRAKFFREEKQHPELVKISLSTSLPLEIIPFELSQAVKAAPSSTAASCSQSGSSEETADARVHTAELKATAKRSAAEAGVTGPEDCKRSTLFSHEISSQSDEAATVHIELLSDDENALYDV